MTRFRGRRGRGRRASSLLDTSSQGSLRTSPFHPAILVRMQFHAVSVAFALLLLAVSCVSSQQLRSATGELLTDFTADDLRQHCPEDYKFCAEKVADGRCFGSSKRADELKRKCPCSCSAVHHKRIQNCCKAVGKVEMGFCLPLCGYNTSLSSLGGGLGIKCVSQLTTWAYCAADAGDNTACCLKSGVPNQCLSFCKGDVPTCDLQSIFSYKPCLKDMDKIVACHKTGLGPKASFDPHWEAECEWE